MTAAVTKAPWPRFVAGAGGFCVGAVIGIAACSGAFAATPVYRCIDKDGGTVYTDIACGGTTVEMPPFDPPDSAAVERLARAREQLARDAAARIARQQRDAEQEALARQWRNAAREIAGTQYRPEQADAPWYDGPLYGYAFGVPVFRSSRPHHPRGPVRAHSRSAAGRRR